MSSGFDNFTLQSYSYDMMSLCYACYAKVTTCVGLLKSQDSKANMSEEERSEASRHILRVIDSLKKKVTADRFTYIKVL